MVRVGAPASGETSLMAQSLFLRQTLTPNHRTAHDAVNLDTERPCQFIDVTPIVLERVLRSGILEGTVTVQSRHTTAAVLVAEDERGLLADLEQSLAAWAPSNRAFHHDDLDAREGPVAVDERRNGHAHVKALLFPPSVTLIVTEGRVDRGRYQSIFLLELDGPRCRTISIQVAGSMDGRVW